MYAVAAWALLRRPALISRTIGVAGRLVPWAHLDARLEKIRRLEQDIYTFARRRPDSAVLLIATELTFHALGVAEVYLTLWMLLDVAPPLVTRSSSKPRTASSSCCSSSCRCSSRA